MNSFEVTSCILAIFASATPKSPERSLLVYTLLDTLSFHLDFRALFNGDIRPMISSLSINRCFSAAPT